MNYAQVGFYVYLGVRALFVLTGIVLLFKREWDHGLALVGIGAVYTPVIIGLALVGALPNIWFAMLALLIMLTVTVLLAEALKKKFPKHSVNHSVA